MTVTMFCRGRAAALLSLLFVALPAAGATPIPIHSFTGADGAGPVGELLMDAAGNLYGAAIAGGGTNNGVVFELVKGNSGYTETVLYSFQGAADGAHPSAALIMDGAGNLYGTAESGGSGNGGVVFELVKGNGYAETVLYSFQSGTDPTFPLGALLMDGAGNLYGTTFSGGSPANLGAVYELVKGGVGYTEQVLYAFQGGADGGLPTAALIKDSAGNLYGTAQSGGIATGPNNSGFGTVFELVKGDGGYTETTLYQFLGGADGSNPNAALIMDGAGNLYGTTAANDSGATGNGTVFELTKSNGGYAETVLHVFQGPDGAVSQTPLLMDKAGNLYGTTVLGGTANDGTVFELQRGSGYGETVLYSFQGGADGANASSGLVADSAGTIYGVTFLGGASGDGTAFELASVISVPPVPALGSAAIALFAVLLAGFGWRARRRAA